MECCVWDRVRCLLGLHFKERALLSVPTLISRKPSSKCKGNTITYFFAKHRFTANQNPAPKQHQEQVIVVYQPISKHF